MSALDPTDHADPLVPAEELVPPVGRVPITTVEHHTAGEPFRIVTGGIPPLEGATVAARRRWAQQHLDEVRALLCREPRGHDGMYGCFVTPGDDAEAALGAVFFHNDGFSTACGHGTIALATWAIDRGMVPVTADGDGDVEVIVDVPSGRVRALATVQGGRATSVRFRNVPAHVHATGVTLHLDAASDRALTGLPEQVRVDVAYGGAYYASLPASSLGLTVDVDDLPGLVAAGRAIQHAADAALELVAPDASGARGLYGVVFHDELAPHHQRNVTVFADGQVDRSPCGSGTSARLALLVEAGALSVGDELVHDSIVGTRFRGRVVSVEDGVPDGAVGTQRVVTEVEGRSFRTGHAMFELDPDDELGVGFLLR